MNSVIDYYTSQILSLEASLKQIRKNFPYLYIFRLVTFVAFLVFLTLFFQFKFQLLFLFLSLAGLTSFLITVKIDLNLVKREQFASSKLLLIQNELKYLDHQYQDQETGDAYFELNPYLSADFEIFGRGSLFQYLKQIFNKDWKKKTCRRFM